MATLAVAGVLAAAYHVCGKTPDEARTAIIEFMNEHTRGKWEMTVGELWDLTDWNN